MITFYYGSGSPYAWRVWLALEHKGLKYEWIRIAFDKKEHKTPEYLALNARGRVPLIVDDGFALPESTLILDYLEEKYPQNPLFSSDLQTKALQRLFMRECDEFLSPHGAKLFQAVVLPPDVKPDLEAVAPILAALKAEYAIIAGKLQGDYMFGTLSNADYTLYGILALNLRLLKRVPSFETSQILEPNLEAWFNRMSALPIIDKTYPPHWKA